MGTALYVLKGKTIAELMRRVRNTCLEASNLGLYEEQRSPILVENGELVIYMQFHS